MKHPLLTLFALSLVLAPLPAAAQMNPNDAAQARIDRLERDIMLLQRQLARGLPGAPATSINPADLPPESSAQLEVRLSAIETELRELRGKTEENEFQVKKISETLDKLQRDTEFRFNELGRTPAGGDKTATPEAPSPERKTFDEAPAADKAADAPDGSTTAGDGVLHQPEDKPDDGSFATPRDMYNYAFRLLNQTKYEEAARVFDGFTKKYPKDPLVGNAYYWQGETFYIRRDYVAAADSFRQGFEALPTGPKAADNLLKLAMSLDALDRDKEACVVLAQIMAKFKKSSVSVIQKAGTEQKRIGCK